MSRSSVCARPSWREGRGGMGWMGREGRTKMDHPAAAPAADARFYSVDLSCMQAYNTCIQYVPDIHIHTYAHSQTAPMLHFCLCS